MFTVDVVRKDYQFRTPFIRDTTVLVNSQHLITGIEVEDHLMVVVAEYRVLAGFENL